MARFVLANRRAGKFHEWEKRSARAAVDRAFDERFRVGARVLGDTARPPALAVAAVAALAGGTGEAVAAVAAGPATRAAVDDTARRIVVFEADPGEVAAKAAGLPSDVLVEPEILHRPMFAYPQDMAHLQRSPAAAATAFVGTGRTVRVTAKGGVAGGTSRGIHGARGTLFLRSFGGTTADVTATADKHGRMAFAFGAHWTPAGLVVSPPGEFWSVFARGTVVDGTTVTCPPLPEAGPLGWWHDVAGVTAHRVRRGAKVRVGVLDTGCGPHPALAHVTVVGSFINGAFDPTGGTDVDMHGSHVCGIIGARPPSGSTAYAGIAPGVELYCGRVFPPDRGANQGDIADGIDSLSREHRVDLINLSLGAVDASQIERDAIVDALERGTLCVCAAANSDGPVEYPAAFPESVAISATGLAGWGPDGTLASIRAPADSDRYGLDNLYLANFSCFGPEIDAAGPGVGIVSTAPERYGLVAPYVSMDGTSMAAPAACAALAAALAAQPAYHALPRDRTRAERARGVIRTIARDVGLARQYQGDGIPQAS